MVKVSEIAAAVGRGVVAGVIGTAAMTVASTAEMKIRGRAPSSAPARAAAKVLRIEPADEADEARFSTMVHWAYGTSWGVVRGLLGALGLRGATGASAHFALVWGTELTMLPALGVAPPVPQWGTKEVAIDAVHHLVYATATSVAYRWLDR